MSVKKVFHYIATFFALIISIAGLWLGLCQDSKINEMSYKDSAMDHQPRIVFDMKPQIVFFKPSMDIVGAKSGSDTLDLALKIETFKVKYVLKNDSDYIVE